MPAARPGVIRNICVRGDFVGYAAIRWLTVEPEIQPFSTLRRNIAAASDTRPNFTNADQGCPSTADDLPLCDPDLVLHG